MNSDFFWASSALLCILNGEGTIVQANPAWEKKLGLNNTEFLQSRYLKWIHPDDKAIAQVQWLQLLTGKAAITFVCRWQDSGNNYRWLQWEISAVPQLNSPTHNLFYAVATDITTQKHTEHKLRNSEERFQLAVLGSGHGLWDWDLRTNQLYLAPRWKWMLGYQEHEVPNNIEEFCQHIHPEDFTQMWATIEAYLDKRIPSYESTHRVCHKDGNYRWMLARAEALWDEHGQPYRMVGIYVDLTERKQIEQALQEKEALLTAIFEATKIGLCVIDEAGFYVRVNPAYCELHGYAVEELLGHRFTTLFPPEEHDNVLKFHDEFLNGKREAEQTRRIQNRQGQWLDVYLTFGRLLQRDGRKFRVTTVTDVTRRKHAEAERDRLFNLSVDLQCIVGFNGRFAEVNPAWERTLGWRKIELLDTLFIRFVHPDDQDSTVQEVRKLLMGQPLCEFENRYLCKNGGYKWLAWNCYPLVESQTVYAIAHDITERKHAEEKIKQQQTFIRLIVDSVPNLIFIKDRFGNFVFANQELADLLGISIDELVNQPYKTELSHSLEDLRLLAETDRRVIEQQEEVETEIAYLNTQGEQHYFHIVKKPLLQDTNEVLVLAVGTDITERKLLELKLKEAISELETILDSSMVGIAYVKHGLFVRINNRLAELLEYTTEELCGLSVNILYSSNLEYQQAEKQVCTLFKQGKGYDFGHLLRTKTNKVLWCRLVGKAVDTKYLNKGSIWMIEDITLQKQAEQNLRLAAKVFETTVDGILVTDLHTHIQRVNPAFSKITGYTFEEVRGKTANFLSSGRHDAYFYDKMWAAILQTGHWQGEIWNRHKSGEIYVAWLSVSAITNEKNKPIQYMGVLTDISRLQEDIENVRYLANYDSLTRLPNRLLFHDNLLRAQAWAHRHGGLFALLFIDLDEFKPVNDQLGHRVGDQLLQCVAERLQNCLRETDMIARLGGDEFTVILLDVLAVEDVVNVATKIVQRMQHPFQIGQHRIILSASIGITVYPHDNSEVNLLIEHADSAMYEAKRAGRGCFRFYKENEIGS